MQLPCRSQDTVVSLGPGYWLCAEHAEHLLFHVTLSAAEHETLLHWWHRA